MKSLRLSLIPLKISLITTIVFIICLVYLNITISEKYKVQTANAIEANQRAVQYFVQAKLNQRQPGTVEKLFDDFESQKNTKYFGIYRIDIIDDYSGEILASSATGDVGQKFNQKILDLIGGGKNNQPFILENDTFSKNVFLVYERFLQTDSYPGLVLIILNDNEIALETTRSFSLLLFIISFFAALIIFFSIFLISGKISMNIKQIANAIDNLMTDLPDIQVPKSNDELGVLGQKVVNLKNLLAQKNEKITTLEQSTQLLKDKKFEIEKSEYSTIDGIFCRVNLYGIQEKMEKQKPEVRDEFLVSIIELFQDNITKAKGRILSFDGTDFLLFYQSEDNETDMINNLIRIKKNLYIYISQYDIATKFDVGFSAAIIYGSAHVGKLKTGSLNFKTITGKTISFLDKISHSSGNDDILIATTDEEKLKTQFSLKPLNRPLKEIPSELRVFYLNDNVETGSNKPSGAKSSEQSENENDPENTEKKNTLSSMLEDTFNNEFF